MLTFLVYSIDKLKARRHWWRVSEASLLGLAALGGPISAWLAMYTAHHKTEHLKFKYGIPIILLIQIAIVLWLTFHSLSAD